MTTFMVYFEVRGGILIEADDEQAATQLVYDQLYGPGERHYDDVEVTAVIPW